MLEWQSENMRRKSNNLCAVVSAAIVLLMPIPALAQEHSIEVPCDSLSIGITDAPRISFFISDLKCRKQKMVQNTPIGNGEIVYSFSTGAIFRFDFEQLDQQHFVTKRPDLEQQALGVMVNALFKGEPISWGQSEERSGWRLTHFGLPNLRELRCVAFAMYRDLRFGEPGYHKRFLGFFCTALHSPQPASSELTTDEISTLLGGLIIPR